MNGVLQKGRYRTLRHQLKKIIMLMHHSYVLQKRLWLMSMSRTCEFKFNALQTILFGFYAAYNVIEYTEISTTCLCMCISFVPIIQLNWAQDIMVSIVRLSTFI